MDDGRGNSNGSERPPGAGNGRTTTAMDDGRGNSDGSERPPGTGNGRTTISGQQARQGQIVLKTRRKRAVFIGGLVAIALLLVLLGVFA